MFISQNTGGRKVAFSRPTDITPSDTHSGRTESYLFFKCCEEIVALVVHQQECGEILDINLTDSLHAQFREIDHFDRLDAILGQHSGRTADRTEVETAMLLAGIGYGLRTVTFPSSSIVPRSPVCNQPFTSMICAVAS